MRALSLPVLIVACLCLCCVAPALALVPKENIYNPGQLKPQDSVLKVKVGDVAPDFSLPIIQGKSVKLSSYRGQKNVILSFVPAAFTPVCSQQWPGYNLARELIEARNGVVIGITVDNIPTLHAWTTQMGGVWFPVASDFYPHGAVASAYGVLRSDGTSERAVFLIDKQGILRFIDVHDINAKPELQQLIGEMEKLPK